MGKVKGEMTKLMEIGTNKLPQNLQEYINLRESRPEQDMMTVSYTIVNNMITIKFLTMIQKIY